MRSKTVMYLFAGALALGASSAGSISPKFELANGKIVSEYTVQDQAQGPVTILPSAGWLKLAALLAAIALFIAAFKVSEETELLEAEANSLLQAERQRRLMRQTIQDSVDEQTETLAANARLAALRPQIVADARWQVEQETGVCVPEMVEASPSPQAAQNYHGKTGEAPAQNNAVATMLDEALAGPIKPPSAATEKKQTAGGLPVIPEPKDMAKQQASLVRALASLKIEAVAIGEPVVGASVIQFRVKLKNSKEVKDVVKLAEPLQLEMGIEDCPIISVKKGAVCVEIPRKDRQMLRFEDWVQPTPVGEPSSLAMAVDIDGNLVEFKLQSRSLKSGVCGGIPGGGKTVLIKTMIGSGAKRYTPADLQYVLLDGKFGAELGFVTDSPFLAKPVAENQDEAEALVKWVWAEVEYRFKLFKAAGVSELDDYNELPGVERLPFLVTFCDEIQNLFDLSGVKAEDKDGNPTVVKILSDIASLGRAAGICLFLSTQRPDRNVIPGQVDAKCDFRAATRLNSPKDSVHVLRKPGAENLMIHGDMMLMPDGGAITRCQGLLTTTADIKPYLFPGEEYGGDLGPIKPPSIAQSAEAKVITLEQVLEKQRQGKKAEVIVSELWNTHPEADNWDECVLALRKLLVAAEG